MRIAGLGFRSEAGIGSLRDALGKAVVAIGGGSVHALATVEEKAGAVSLLTIAAELGLPVRAVTRARLAEMDTPTQSVRVIDRFGTGSLAEAAALGALGPGARLIVARVVSDDGMATAAIAEGSDE